MQAFLTGMGWLTSTGPGRGMQEFASPGESLRAPSREQVLESPDERFCRMDAFSKIGLAAAAKSLEDAGLAGKVDKHPAGIAAATRFGCISTDVDFLGTVFDTQGRWPSPHLFTYTLPNCFLGETALRFGLTGPSYVLHRSSPFSLGGVKAALYDLNDGEAEMMLAGSCDLQPPGGIDPWLDSCRHDAAGAVFVVLEAELRSQSRPYALVRLESDSIRLGSKQVHTMDDLVLQCQVLENSLSTTKT